MSPKKKDHSFSTIQLKLNSLIKPRFYPVIVPLFDQISKTITKIAYESYILANLHILRCLNEPVPLPKPDQNFFYSCCSLVTCSGRDVGDEQLRLTAEQYRSLRPEGWSIPDGKYIGRAMNSLAREMATMTKNHIVLNIVSRLCSYIRLKHKSIGNKATAQRFIESAFYEKGILTDDVKEFKEWLVLNPLHERVVEENMDHFIRKLYDIQQFYLTLEPTTKGLKTFTLLPMKSGYTGTFFMIDPSTLPDILKLLGRSIQMEILKAMMERVQSESDEHGFLENRLKAITIFNEEFQSIDAIKDCLWDILFKTTKYDTIRRKFAKVLSTDGYTVTVYMKIPIEENPREFDSIRGLKEEEFDRFVGIDPGYTYVCTAYSGDTKSDGTSKYTQISTGELHHDSKVYEERKWMEGQRKRNPWYDDALKSLPSLKTGNYDAFKRRVKQTLLVAEFLFGFQRRTKFRAWRFKKHRFGQKAMVKGVQKIVGEGVKNERILVGYGDWSQQDGFLKGREQAPVKKMRRMMRLQGIKVVSVDEHRTSKCCSGCCTGETEKVKLNGRECHQIIRCRNNECNVYWQRDLNASRNIRSVLISMVRMEQRPDQLERKRRCTSL
jgi:transposase